MIATISQDSRFLVKESKADSRFKKESPFAICALVETRCWVRTGHGIWGTFMMISKASALSIGVTRERRCWCSTFRFGTISINNFHSKNLSLSSLEINWKILCVFNVKNSSANGISLNWKRSKQEVDNWAEYVLLVRTGCGRGIPSSLIRMLESIKRKKETLKSKFTSLSLL